MLESLLIFLLIVVIIAWIISILPIPASPFPIKTILYVILGVFVIIRLLRYA